MQRRYPFPSVRWTVRQRWTWTHQCPQMESSAVADAAALAPGVVSVDFRLPHPQVAIARPRSTRTHRDREKVSPVHRGQTQEPARDIDPQEKLQEASQTARDAVAKTREM